jgi:hypothetical protein
MWAVFSVTGGKPAIDPIPILDTAGFIGKPQGGFLSRQLRLATAHVVTLFAALDLSARPFSYS